MIYPMPDIASEEPSFPPLLSSHPTPVNADPVDIALSQAALKQAGAGDLFWSADEDRLKFALVLEPEVTRQRCYEMLYVAMVAFGDAAGALMPPEVSVTYVWPSSLLVNEGETGHVDLHIAPTTSEADIPDWLVLSMDIELRPQTVETDPGLNYHRTTFWEEGCGHITKTELLNSIARHFLTWLHNWEEEGFRPVYNQWMQRLNAKENISLFYDGVKHQGDFVGMEESGNAFLRSNGKTIILQTSIALKDKRTPGHDQK